MRLASKVESIQAASECLELPDELEAELIDKAARIDWQYDPEAESAMVGLPDGCRLKLVGVSIVDNCHASAYSPGLGWSFLDLEDAATWIADSLKYQK